MTELKNIPCNVITGFLGSGKTTAILHLLSQKPADERWAVLVNEFGQMGIDGDVIASQHAYVKEIPGGCMCCSAGVPVQVALNALLKQARPHRLLIEPTGIGHPRQIIKQLSSAPFDEVLDMRACITLLDPRHLQNSRYTDNDLFNDQIAIADVLVANKTDLCDPHDQQTFIKLAEQGQHPKMASGWVQQGQLDFQWLDVSHQVQTASNITNTRFQKIVQSSSSLPAYQSLNWVFTADKLFDYVAIMACITELKLARVKALLKTDQGDVYINSVAASSSVMKMDTLADSRIEIIHNKSLSKEPLTRQFQACIMS